MEDFTFDDCCSLIKKCVNMKEVKLINYNLRPISDDVLGLLGDHCILETIFSKSENGKENVEKINFFIKSMPKKNPELAEYLTTSGLFKKEQLLLSNLFPKLLEYSSVPWTAKCYHSGEVIILENLVKSGYSILKHNNFFDYRHAESTVKTLARFHSSSIIYEHTNENIMKKHKEALYETRYVTDEDHPRYKFVRTTLSAIRELLKLMPNYKNDYQVKFDKIAERLVDTSKPSQKYLNVVTHGDLWVNNIMFKDDCLGVSSVLIDFQLSRYTVPVSDLIAFIHMSTNAAFREEYLDSLMSAYHSTMREELECHGLDVDRIFPLEELLDTWNIYKPAYLIDCAIVSPEINLNQDIIRQIVRDRDVFQKFTFEDRSDVVCKAFKEDSAYRERISDILNEIIDCIC